MENSTTLQDFNENVDAYAKVRGFIEKAKTRGAKFSPEVIEKVCLTHEVKSMEIAELILPSVASIEQSIATLMIEIETVAATKGGAGEILEELELRHDIGELSEDDFEQQSASLKEELSTADSKIGTAQSSADEYKVALERWVELATAADQDTGTSAQSNTAVVEEEVAPVEEAAPPVIESDDEQVVAAAPDEGSLVPGSDDVPGSDEPESADEPEIAFGEPAAAESEELFAEDPAVGVVVAADTGSHAFPPTIEIDAKEEEEDAGEVDDRRALLLYQEGTADETIYPFDGEEITIGRGRTNVIQIKNDSKVSRQHCRLFKSDGGEYYIKDNNSSNGSLVNGELITERRLFGGEEVIIGETFFRFRIME
jgi:hypothetical protein